MNTKKILIDDFQMALQLVCPDKYEKVLIRFLFDYGCTTFGLEKKKIKAVLFHINFIFKLGSNGSYRPKNYNYRLTNDEINKILSLL